MKPHAAAIWLKHATEIHGIHKNHTSIITVDPLQLVWECFLIRVRNIVPIGHEGVLMVWNR